MTTTQAIDTTPTTEEIHAAVEALAAHHGIKYTAMFVPHSQSRHAHEPDLAPHMRPINWKITISNHGAAPLITDYSQGVGHLPWFTHRPRDRYTYNKATTQATEDGKWFKSKMYNKNAAESFGSSIFHDRTKPLDPPTLTDVLYSLAIDSDVLNHASYEDWADCYGYDHDSRSGYATYEQCMAIAVRLRSMIDLTKLQTITQDY